MADQYGVGEVAGTVIGIPKNAPHAEAAWKFVRFVTTDTATVVEYANLFGNVPTTKAAAASPDLKFPAEFQTFLDIYADTTARATSRSTRSVPPTRTLSPSI